MYRRRDFLRSGALGVAALTFGPGFWRDALAASPATPGPGPYGPLGPPDANGIRLPRGFRSRVIARGGVPVEGTRYEWHFFSDGQATFPTRDGGFILVSNSEAPERGRGGASAIRFDADGRTRDAYRILGGTTANCSGGATPWGTWLSCEEVDDGRVWECDPAGTPTDAVVRPAMGVFKHEAAAVDPEDKRIYLTEDLDGGGLYRFTPASYPDLDEGLLEIAVVGRGGEVSWAEVPDPAASSGPTHNQVSGSTEFRRAEGIWFDSGVVYLATTGDGRIQAYDTKRKRIEVLYDAAQLSDPPLSGVDQITVSRSGDLFLCEDDDAEDELDLAIVTPKREVARFLTVTGREHRLPGPAKSELTGVAFDPSGGRMYFSSQRAYATGVVYQVTGPFRGTLDAGSPRSAADGDETDGDGGVPLGGVAAGAAALAGSAAAAVAIARRRRT